VLILLVAVAAFVLTPHERRGTTSGGLPWQLSASRP